MRTYLTPLLRLFAKAICSKKRHGSYVSLGRRHEYVTQATKVRKSVANSDSYSNITTHQGSLSMAIHLIRVAHLLPQ